MEDAGAASKMKLDVDEQLAKLLESQKLAKKEEREYTEEERRIKQQILSQYSQVSDNKGFFLWYRKSESNWSLQINFCG